MTQFSLSAVIFDMQMLSMQTYLCMSMKHDVQATEGDLDKLASMLGRATVAVKAAGLPKSSANIDAAIEWIGSFGRLLTMQALGVKLSAIYDGIREEASSLRFLTVDPLGDHPKPANEDHLKTGQRAS